MTSVSKFQWNRTLLHLNLFFFISRVKASKTSWILVRFKSFLGSGPDRGRSPVEWGDFPSARSFVRPSLLQLALRPLQLALRPLVWKADERMAGCTDESRAREPLISWCLLATGFLCHQSVLFSQSLTKIKVMTKISPNYNYMTHTLLGLGRPGERCSL